MIAVDTNVLVYAYTAQSVFNGRASSALRDLVGRGQPWAIPWPCVHEFLSVMSNPKIQTTAPSIESLIDLLRDFTLHANVRCIGESTLHLRTIRDLASNGAVRGGQVHDARIAAICLDHSVQELWTADRDFSRFPRLKTRNPLVS